MFKFIKDGAVFVKGVKETFDTIKGFADSMEDISGGKTSEVIHPELNKELDNKKDNK